MAANMVASLRVLNCVYPHVHRLVLTLLEIRFEIVKYLSRWVDHC